VRTLVIKYKDPRKLRPRLKNPRTHSARQIKQIAASITEFGFINPVLIDGADEVVAGHARVSAAIFLGMMDVPTVRVDHLSAAQIRAYVIATTDWLRTQVGIENCLPSNYRSYRSSRILI